MDSFSKPPFLGKGRASHRKGFLWRETGVLGKEVILSVGKDVRLLVF